MNLSLFDIRKYITAVGSSAVLTLIIFYVMQWLIATGDVELNEKGIRIADVTMPERELELLHGYRKTRRRRATS